MPAVDLGQVAQPAPESWAVEDVVPQHQGCGIAVEEVLAQQECLGQAFGPGLDDIVKTHAEVVAVAEQAGEGGLVLGVVMMRISRSPAFMRVEMG